MIRKTLKKLVAWITIELQQSNKNNIEKKEKKLFLETQTLSAKKEQHRFQVHDFNSIFTSIAKHARLKRKTTRMTDTL